MFNTSSPSENLGRSGLFKWGVNVHYTTDFICCFPNVLFIKNSENFICISLLSIIKGITPIKRFWRRILRFLFKKFSIKRLAVADYTFSNKKHRYNELHKYKSDVTSLSGLITSILFKKFAKRSSFWYWRNSDSNVYGLLVLSKLWLFNRIFISDGLFTYKSLKLWHFNSS